MSSSEQADCADCHGRGWVPMRLRGKIEIATCPAGCREPAGAVRATHAPCGCPLVQCDACDRMVPKGESADLSPEQSGSAQCDTTACAYCRGAEASEVHPTCDACGSCDACGCHAAPVIDRRYGQGWLP